MLAEQGLIVYHVAYGEGIDAKWSRLLRILAKDVNDDLVMQKMRSLGLMH